MTERILMIFAFLVLCGFIGILVWRVPQLDIGSVALLTVLLAAYDFFIHRARADGH